MREKGNGFFKTLRYICMVFVIALGLMTIVGTGGGGGGGDDDDTDISDVVLPETTKGLNDSTLQHLSSVSPDGSTFTFDESTPQLDSLNSNDVIVVNVTDVTPYGALRKVTSVLQVGDEVVVETTQATLEDAIESGTIEVARVLTASDIQSASALIEGIALKTHSAISEADGVLHVDMNNVVLYDEDGNLGTTDDQIRANGAIDIDPGFDFKIEMDRFTIEKLSFTNNITETVNLELSSQITIDTYNEVEIARYYFTPITVSILVITPVLTVNVGFDGEVSAGITTNVTQTATLTAGLSYDSGVWNPVCDFSNEFQFNPPVLFAEAAVKGYAGPQLSLLLYGVTGPYNDINGYLELNADLLGDPWWELYGGLFVDLGVEIDILGVSLPDYYVTILDHKVKLADGGGTLVGSSWSDGFETYSVGTFPSSWVADANATNLSTNFVDNEYSNQGNQSLKLYGNVDGCWAALSYRPIVAEQPFEVQVAVRNGNESLYGCHPDRASLGLREGYSWTNPGRSFIQFKGDGTIISGGGGVSLGTYNTLDWYIVKVRYEKLSSTTIELSYWINGTYKGSETLSAISAEDQLANLEVVVQEGTAWFDDIAVNTLN